jgi:hypothetical protein
MSLSKGAETFRVDKGYIDPLVSCLYCLCRVLGILAQYKDDPVCPLSRWSSGQGRGQATHLRQSQSVSRQNLCLGCP